LPPAQDLRSCLRPVLLALDRERQLLVELRASEAQLTPEMPHQVALAPRQVLTQT
jgi:hypothetical protein